MTGAELKTLREAMGLSVGWLAERVYNRRLDQVGVERRTVERWESDDRTVPDDVADYVAALWLEFGSWVHQAIEATHELIATASQDLGESPAEIALYRYRDDDHLHRAHPELTGYPVTYHAQALARLKATIEAECDVDVMIDYAPAM